MARCSFRMGGSRKQRLYFFMESSQCQEATDVWVWNVWLSWSRSNAARYNVLTTTCRVSTLTKPDWWSWTSCTLEVAKHYSMKFSQWFDSISIFWIETCYATMWTITCNWQSGVWNVWVADYSHSFLLKVTTGVLNPNLPKMRKSSLKCFVLDTVMIKEKERGV